MSCMSGFVAPIKYASLTSAFSASPAATIFFARYLAAYAPPRSTLDGSLPLKHPPPTLAYPPYVSTTIFLPVRPQSEAGPPLCQTPVPLTITSFGSISKSYLLSIGVTTSLYKSFLTWSSETSSLCGTASTTLVTLCGLPFLYSTVT